MSYMSVPRYVKARIMYDLICAHPGIHRAEIARKMGVHRSTVTRLLPVLEQLNLMISEDNGGELYGFKL